MKNSKILPGIIIGLVIGGIAGIVINSGQFNLLSGAIVGGIIGFLGGWFMSKDADSSDGDGS